VKALRLAAGLALLGASVFCLAQPLHAQWLKYPTAGVPRTADGRPNLAAPAPRTADGKPDFSGLWLTGDGGKCPPGKDGSFQSCFIELPISRLGINIAQGVPGGLPYQPGVAAVVKKRMADNAKDDPHARCMPDTFLRAYGLPHMEKFVQVPGLLIMLDEMNANYRQVFTDGRPLPQDPDPAWNGYSSAHWDGDTLVVDSIGFRDDIWLDVAGNYIGTSAKIQERIRRPEFGHLKIDITVDDPKTYTKPWTVHLTQDFALNTELIDEICVENEKSSHIMLSKQEPAR
jgi:hypothetical protein